jgi:hypothetical protein
LLTCHFHSLLTCHFCAHSHTHLSAPPLAFPWNHLISMRQEFTNNWTGSFSRPFPHLSF